MRQMKEQVQGKAEFEAKVEKRLFKTISALTLIFAFGI